MKCNATPRIKRKKKKKNTKTKEQRTMVIKGKTMKYKDHKKPRQIRDTESHQLLDEESQTYFYQEVW